jgi:hypothetical protein
MKRIIVNGWLVAVCGTVLLAAGCTTYYKVTDPQSGRVYYTDKIDSDRSGVVKLKDARSKSTVTLQSSEVKEISSSEYKEGLAAPESKPAPASTPAPVPASSGESK